MALFEVRHDTTRSVDETWARLTDWRRHGDFMPFTTVTVTPALDAAGRPPNGVGTVFTAHTGLGRLGFDDPMEIVEWVPPTAGRAGRCRLEKRGAPMHGWAVLTVEPHAAGARVTWREDIRVGRLPRLTDPVTRVFSKILFSKVLRRLVDS